MWDGTHLVTSSKVHAIQDPEKTAVGIIRDLDTSFCQNYDQPGVDNVYLNGISQHQQSAIHEDFDYAYMEELEGVSARNNKRKYHFSTLIDHVNNPNRIV